MIYFKSVLNALSTLSRTMGSLKVRACIEVVAIGLYSLAIFSACKRSFFDKAASIDAV
jgi:hypothetical protein